MEKRLPLALALSILFVMLYLQSTPQPVAPAGAAGDGAAAPVGESVAPGVPGPGFAGSTEPVPVDSGAAAGRAKPRSGEAAVPAAGPEAPLVTETLQTEDTRAVWTSLGAGLTHLELLDLHPDAESEQPLPLLDRLDGQTPNLLLRDVADVYGLDRVRWSVERQHSSEGDRLEFTYRAADGLVFTRGVSPGKGPYLQEVSISVRNEGSERLGSLSLVLESARGLVDLGANSRFYGRPTAVAVLAEPTGEHEVVKWHGSDLRGDGRTISADEELLAAGTMINYFASVLVPVDQTDVRQVYPVEIENQLKLERLVAAKKPADERDAARWRAELADDVKPAAGADLQFLVLGLDPGATQEFRFELFTGPKSADLAALEGLAFVTPLIESAYGMWAWINKTLLAILRFFHGLVGNWGVAIVLLTVLVRGALFPLNRRQQTSMTRYSSVMQKLKPQLDELKAKLKNNPRKFQEEQMKLLKAHGATPPLGGCLLTFLQFPVWISLYQVLGTSIELRQAPFVGWVSDLSQPDAMPFGFFGFETLNLLPVLMCIATIVQMRYQPKAADSQQQQTQKIMGSIMPLLMLVFLYSYSSGLSLYILTSSLLGIFEFRVIRRVWPIDTSSPSTRAPVRAAKA